MKAIRIILFFSLLLTSQITFGQGFSYTFEDPCTFKPKTIFVNNPSGNVFLTYNGQIKSFTPQQLQSGAVESWVNEVKSQNVSGPCSGVALAQTTQIGQYIAQNSVMVLSMVMGQLGSMDFNSGVSLTDVSGIAQNAVSAQSTNETSDNSQKETKPENGKEQFCGQEMSYEKASNGTTIHFTQDAGGNVYLAPTKITPGSLANTNNNQNGTNNSNNGGVTTSNQNQAEPNGGIGGGTQTGSNQTGGNTSNTNGDASVGNQSNGESVNNNQNNTQSGTNNGSNSQTGGQNNTNNTNGETTTQVKTDDKKDIAGGGGSDIKTNGSVKSKVANAQKGGIIATGDIVGIRSAAYKSKDQFKINLSFTKANTTNTKITGAMINFTTVVKNSSVTLYRGYRYKSLTTIFSNTSMINFDYDLFNTTSIMESYKYKKFTSTLGVNFTGGKIGKSKFNSLTAMGGVMTNFTIKKNWVLMPMVIVVYSPYIYYYEGLWYKSGFMALPFLSCDYRVSNKFKMNISFSGVQQINDKTLNYQILFGGRAML